MLSKLARCYHSSAPRVAHLGGESMSDDTDKRLIKPPVVVESFGDLDGKSRLAIRRVAASATVEVLAKRLRELCAAFDKLDADALGNAAQDALWRAYDLMEDAGSALDEAGRNGEDGQRLNSKRPKLRPTA